MSIRKFTLKVCELEPLQRPQFFFLFFFFFAINDWQFPDRYAHLCRIGRFKNLLQSVKISCLCLNRQSSSQSCASLAWISSSASHLEQLLSSSVTTESLLKLAYRIPLHSLPALKSVSYTHLDVYKRQAYTRTKHASLCKSEPEQTKGFEKMIFHWCLSSNIGKSVCTCIFGFMQR